MDQPAANPTQAAPAGGVPALTEWTGALTLEQYWMGRNKNPAYAAQVTPELVARAQITVARMNQLATAMRTDGVRLYLNPKTRNVFDSGWRPPAVNAATPGAALFSLHMTAEAGDLFDPYGDLDNWCLDNLQGPPGLPTLASIGLWLEHPSATKGWCHVQTRPPRSNRRVFFP